MSLFKRSPKPEKCFVCSVCGKSLPADHVKMVYGEYACYTCLYGIERLDYQRAKKAYLELPPWEQL